MPSTVVHVGLAGLMGTALLGEKFDTKAILVVLAATAAVDLDTLVGMVVWPGTHRAAFHNVFVVAIPAAVLYWDASRGDESYVLGRWGADGYRAAWVTLCCVLVAHVMLDAFYNGAGLLWPLDNTFYDLSGRLYVSNREGLVQTFVEFAAADDGSREVAESTAAGTTEDTHYETGFDPGPDAGEDPERIFPIAYSGELFVVALAGYLTVGVRLWQERLRAE